MDAEAVVFARTLSDAQLLVLTKPSAAGKAGIYHGHVHDGLREGDFPRVTFVIPSDIRVRRTYGDVRINLTAWVWPSGTNGGWSRIRELDVRLRELLDEQQWLFGQMLVYAQAGAGREIPDEPTRPIGFARGYTLSQGTP